MVEASSQMDYVQTDPGGGEGGDLGSDESKYAREAKRLEEEGKDQTCEYGLALSNLAACVGRRGDEDHALQLYALAKVAYEAAGATNSPGYADSLLNLGDALVEQSRFEEAMSMLSAADAIYIGLGWLKTMNRAVVLHNMGECLAKQGASMKAAEQYKVAKTAYEAVIEGTHSPQYKALLEDMAAVGIVAPNLEEPSSMAELD